MTNPNDVFAVIMAGGSGTRFWPLSRNARPKQLVHIVGDTTMIQATVSRLQPLIPPDRVLVITTAALAEETRKQLPALKPEHVIAEPVGRDTAACVCLAALVVEKLSPGAVMIGRLITGVSLMPLAFVYQSLSTRKPKLAAGPYAYARAGFGHFVGFNSA